MTVAAAAPAARAAAGKSAGRARAAKATSKAGATPKAGTAKARAQQLVGEGKSRKDAARIVRDEYGSTLAEAEGLLEDTGDAGAAEAPASPARRRRSSTPLPRSAARAVNAGGGAILGALTYVLALTYLRDGSAGVKRWMRAKFLNQVEGS